jgi:cytoskeleton protein RodZ
MAERDTDFELPLENAGARLRRAREQAGLSLGDIAARTKIAERHLVLIEEGNYAAMASRAYAIGFARNYARALGLDEKEIAASVRDDFDDMVSATDRRPAPAFEPGDPARVPGSRLAWIAALSALAAILLTALIWHNFYTPGATLPDLTAPKGKAPAAAQTQPAAAPAPGGPVVFTATIPAVWVKFYDADGKQLLQKELAQGESFTVPPDAKGPMLWTARPDALQVTVGGQEVPRISTKQENVKDVLVSAAALLARPAGSPPAAVSQSAPDGAAAQPAPQATRTPATVRVPLARPARSDSRTSASPAAAESPATQPSTVSD